MFTPCYLPPATPDCFYFHGSHSAAAVDGAIRRCRRCCARYCYACWRVTRAVIRDISPLIRCCCLFFTPIFRHAADITLMLSRRPARPLLLTLNARHADFADIIFHAATLPRCCLPRLPCCCCHFDVITLLEIRRLRRHDAAAAACHVDMLADIRCYAPC